MMIWAPKACSPDPPKNPLAKTVYIFPVVKLTFGIVSTAVVVPAGRTSKV